MNTTRFEACKAYFIEGYLMGAGDQDREAAEDAFREHVHNLALSTEHGQSPEDEQ